MEIKQLNTSNALKPGQLLLAFKGSKFYGKTAYSDLQQGVEIGDLHFYRHRQEPVPWTGRLSHGRLFRHPRTTNERRAHFGSNTTKESLESHGITFKLRYKRSSHMLPTTYDDLSIRYQRNWKKHRGTQRKNADSIDRRSHGPPFWAW